jgi:hypothetical protein
MVFPNLDRDRLVEGDTLAVGHLKFGITDMHPILAPFPCHCLSQFFGLLAAVWKTRACPPASLSLWGAGHLIRRCMSWNACGECGGCPQALDV